MGYLKHSLFKKSLEKIQTFPPFSASDCCMPTSGSISLPTSITFFSFSGFVALPAILISGAVQRTKPSSHEVRTEKVEHFPE